MSRTASLVAAPVIAAALAAGCAPVFDNEIGWTIDGEDPANVCGALPASTLVEWTATSRSNADERFGGDELVTVGTADCGKGTTTLPTGPFADVLLRLKDGDTVLGTASPLRLSPGAPPSGDQLESAPVVADIRVTQGSLAVSLTVGGRRCGDAGAAAFNVTLSEYREARTAVPVASGVSVGCVDNSAVFTFAPVRVGATYLVSATTDVAGAVFSTPEIGEGVVIDGAVNVANVDVSERR
jgi:hypothetical protein